MDEYLIWLIFLALSIFALSMFQLKDRHYRQLQADNQRLQTDLNGISARLREREGDIDQMQRSSANLLKWKSRAAELEEELKTTKQTQEYADASRLEYLEGCLESSAGKAPSALFLETFQPRGLYTFDEKLCRMLERAEFEVVIVSPWIKRQMWERIKGPLKRFVRQGGKVRVFMRGCESDFSAGLSDDLVQDIRDLGGDVFPVRQLHAKLYVVDRKEAIIASANLTKGGIEGNYEAGVWLNDPLVMKDICLFLEDLYRCR
jgi:hypothetical protein